VASPSKLPAHLELRGGQVEFAGFVDSESQAPDQADSPPAKKAKRKRFKMHAYTGSPVEFLGIPMVFDLNGMQAASGTPILQQHNHEKIVALSDKAVIDHTGLHFEGYCYDTEAAREVIGLAESDPPFPWQASMGVKPLDVEFVDEGQKRTINGKEFSGPFLHVLKSKVKESSFVPLGADDATRSLVFADDAAGTVTIRRITMSVADPAADQLKAERKRISDISEAFPDDPAFANKHIALGSSVLEAKAAYAEVLKNQLQQLSSRPSQTPVPTRGAPGPAQGATYTQRFQDRVQELMGSGRTKGDAIRHIAIHQAELHQGYLEEYNAAYRPRTRG
jgi:uncharacterized protein YoaH (UPF0181 family)